MSTIGPDAGLGQAGGEGDGVRFADADVEEAVGEVGADLFELVALAHGRGDDRDAFGSSCIAS